MKWEVNSPWVISAKSGNSDKPPAIEALPPRTQPTEPGWYVARWNDKSEQRVVAVERMFTKLRAHDGPISAGLSNFTFIARIFPDRIGQE